ncbi:MAG: hypothetical protein HKN90_03890 [Flavobacteriaceae bacterium]|nr:hypothetical protein [Flavobacteriaceae bacterium]
MKSKDKIELEMEFFKQLTAIVLLIFMCTLTGFSQEENATIKALDLSAEQKNILKEQLELTKQIRESIKSNLTSEQKKMLANRNLTRADRAKLLRKSLSVRQLDNIKRNQHLLRDKRIRFRKTISKRQMRHFRSFVRDRHQRDRRRLIRRLRDLIRDNITDSQ